MASDAALFSATKNQTETKEVYMQLAPTVLDKDLNARNLLAALACMGLHLPKASRSLQKRAACRPLTSPGERCTQFTLDKEAGPGLTDLKALVESSAPPDVAAPNPQ